MRAAVVEITTGAVLNVIVAYAAVDEAPEGCVLWPVPESMTINSETVWTEDGPSNPPLPVYETDTTVEPT